jgi:DNA-damage-inducible protein J
MLYTGDVTREQANFRIDAAAKARAYQVLEQIGLRPSDAVNMFMHHIAMFGELPFRPRVPNARTLDTFAKTDAGQDLTRHRSVDAVFEEL